MKASQHTHHISHDNLKRHAKVFRPFSSAGRDESLFSNFPLKAIVLLLLILFLLGLRGLAATYYTAASGDPKTTTNWWTNTDGTGSHPANFSGVSDVFIIQNGDNMLTITGWTVSGTITVNSGGILTIASGDKLDVATLNVSGTFVNQSATAHKIDAMTVNSGGIYQHDVDAGTIPTATWATGSTCLITKLKGGAGSEPAGDGQAFYNLTYYDTVATGNLEIATSGLSIAGNFNVLSVHGQELRFHQASTTVGGNCTINDNTRLANNGNPRTLTVNGKFTLSGGTLKMTDNNDVGILNIGGDMEITGGTLTETSATGPDSAVVVFTSGTHVYSKSGGTISEQVDFRVETGAVLNVGTSIISGSLGTFNLKAGAGIITANTNGLTASSASGSIQVTGSRF